MFDQQRRYELEEQQEKLDRHNWRVPDDKHYTENPRECFMRTVEQSNIRFEGPKKINPETRMIFLVPIYYKEWRQGNIQRLLRNALSNAVHQKKPIELNFVINFAVEDRDSRNRTSWDSNPIWKKYKDEQKPPRIQPSDDEGYDRVADVDDWRFIPDFTKMTYEEYLQFRDYEYGAYTPFEHLLQERFAADAKRIQEDYQQMTSFLSDVVDAQRLGMQIKKNPTLASLGGRLQRFLKGSTEFERLLAKYDDQPELHQIISLAYESAGHIQVSAVDTVHADFMAEGYGKKGLASVRCIGADYARLRKRELKKRLIVQHWDVDLIPSSNFVDDLVEFYDRHPEKQFVSLPTAGLPAPGTSLPLFLTSLQFNAAGTPRLSGRG